MVVMLRLLLLSLYGLAVHAQRAQNLNSILSIEDEDKKQYLDQSLDSSAYDFGYEIGPSGQFHHEDKGPDGIVYGCYGYIDPYGQLAATHYVSDGWGYRTVSPGQPVELFFHPHDPGEHNSHENHHSHSDHDDHNHDHHGVITPYDQLHFPKGCGNKERPQQSQPLPPRPGQEGPEDAFGSANLGVSGQRPQKPQAPFLPEDGNQIGGSSIGGDAGYQGPLSPVGPNEVQGGQGPANTSPSLASGAVQIPSNPNENNQETLNKPMKNPNFGGGFYPPSDGSFNVNANSQLPSGNTDGAISVAPIGNYGQKPFPKPSQSATYRPEPGQPRPTKPIGGQNVPEQNLNNNRPGGSISQPPFSSPPRPILPNTDESTNLGQQSPAYFNKLPPSQSSSPGQRPEICGPFSGSQCGPSSPPQSPSSGFSPNESPSNPSHPDSSSSHFGKPGAHESQHPSGITSPPEFPSQEPCGYPGFYPCNAGLQTESHFSSSVAPEQSSPLLSSGGYSNALTTPNLPTQTTPTLIQTSNNPYGASYRPQSSSNQPSESSQPEVHFGQPPQPSDQSGGNPSLPVENYPSRPTVNGFPSVTTGIPSPASQPSVTFNGQYSSESPSGLSGHLSSQGYPNVPSSPHPSTFPQEKPSRPVRPFTPPSSGTSIPDAPASFAVNVNGPSGHPSHPSSGSENPGHSSTASEYYGGSPSGSPPKPSASANVHPTRPQTTDVYSSLPPRPPQSSFKPSTASIYSTTTTPSASSLQGNPDKPVAYPPKPSSFPASNLPLSTHTTEYPTTRPQPNGLSQNSNSNSHQPHLPIGTGLTSPASSPRPFYPSTSNAYATSTNGLNCDDTSGFGPAAGPGCSPAGQPYQTSQPAGFTSPPGPSYPDYSQTGYPDGRPPSGSQQFVEEPHEGRPSQPLNTPPPFSSQQNSGRPQRPHRPISSPGSPASTQPEGNSGSRPPLAPYGAGSTHKPPASSSSLNAGPTDTSTNLPEYQSTRPPIPTFSESSGLNLSGSASLPLEMNSQSAPGEHSGTISSQESLHTQSSSFVPPSSNNVFPDENSITDHPDEILQGSFSPDKKPYPIYVIPFPINIVPSPSSCPCYLVTSGNNGTSSPPVSQPQLTQAQSSTNGQSFSVIGYIPVVFYPYCPGNESNHETVGPMFPSALSVPYPCNQCGQPQANEQVFGRKLNHRTQSSSYDRPQQSQFHESNNAVEGVQNRAPRRRKVVYGRRVRQRKVRKEET